MTGAKVRSGGARQGAGRPRRNLHLDARTARTLLLLTKERRALLNNPDASEEDVVAKLVDDAWCEHNEIIEQAAIEAAN